MIIMRTSSVTALTANSGLLSSIAGAIHSRIAYEGMVGEWGERGEHVSRLRDYYDGTHDAALTDDMRDMLRISQSADVFNSNYIPVVVDAMTNRLLVSDVRADNDAATEWLQALLERVSFDEIQRDVHLATLLDGDGFVMVAHNGKNAHIIPQLAYDGCDGIIPIYESDSSPVMVCAIKIWSEVFRLDHVGKIEFANRVRINIYYADRIEKFFSEKSGAAIQPYINAQSGETTHVHAWTKRDGSPLGIPIFHFKNRGRKNFGISEAANAMPLQDALNRTLWSLISTSEKTGFPLRIAYGFDPDPRAQGIKPGDIILVGAGGMDREQQAKMETLPEGSLDALMNTARHLRMEIGNVTGTPAPELFDADNLSGEAFAAREVTMIGKVEAAQKSFGAMWRRIFDMAWEVEDAYSFVRPPDYTQALSISWKDANLRADSQVIRDAVAIAETGRLSNRAFLSMIAATQGWSADEVQRILQELEDDKQALALSQIGSLPNFDAALSLDTEA